MARIIITYKEKRPYSIIDFLTTKKAYNYEGIIRKRWKQYSLNKKKQRNKY